MMFSYPNKSLLANYVIGFQGFITQKFWDNSNMNWITLYRMPEIECSIYGKCGEFGYGNCNSLDHNKLPICKCLKGFIPRNIEEWNKGNWTMGCVRRMPLQCNQNNSKITIDGFLQLETMKIPDHAIVALGYNDDECRSRRLMNFSCLAYSYYSGIGCMSWNTNLIDIVELSSGGATLYIRLASGELGKDNNNINFLLF